MFKRRTLDVAVAVVFEPDWGFFLSYNPRWHGYSLPMRKRRQTDFDLAHCALEAWREATNLPLRWDRTPVQPLAYLEIEGESRGTGKTTRYHYHVFQIDPPIALSAEVAPLGFACQRGFLKPQDIVPAMLESPSAETEDSTREAAITVLAPLGADLVTWSTRQIVEDLIGNQRVALAVICRRGVEGPEFLMNRNPSYGGYFPIASRCRIDASPMFEVREAVRKDTGYRPSVEVGKAVVVEDRHFSPRFRCERHFIYSLFPVTIRRVDLGNPDNELESCLERSRLLWDWIPDDKMNNPVANDLSPTISKIREALRQIARQSGCG